MTQTTAERIATLINEGVDCSCDGGWTHESVVGVLEVAAVIATEIDALTQTNALMLESAERGQATIAELRALIPVSRVDLGAHDKTISALAAELNALRAEIDALTRERDEARAELAGLDAGMRFQFDRAEDYKAQRDEAREMIARLKPSWMGDSPRPETLVETCQRLAGEVNALTRERDEALAEADRLRPAAEAWEASRFYSDLMDMDAADPTADGYRRATDDEIIGASIACQKADARARAAKARRERDAARARAAKGTP